MDDSLNLKYKYHFDNFFAGNSKPCNDILLYQVGEMLCESHTLIKEHVQYCFELTYVLSGKGIIYTNDIPIHVKKNDCYISIPNERHRIISDKDEPLRFCFLAYGAHQSQEIILINNYIEKNFADEKSRLTNIIALEDIFLNLLSEITQSDVFNNMMLSFYIKELIITLFRHITNNKPTAYIVDKSNSSYLVYQIVNYIDKTIFTMKNLNELEDVFNYNYQYLSRCFIKHMHMTLNRYFVYKRMEKAGELLITTNLSISKISEKLNYSTIHSFSKAFQNHFGVAPSHYKSQLNT